MTFHQTDSAGCKCQLQLMSCSFIIEKSASSFLSHHFQQAVHSQCIHTVSAYTQYWTLSAWITACTRGCVCFSSSQRRVEGRNQGTVRSQLSLYLHKQCAFINCEIPLLIAIAITMCDKDFVMQIKWDPWSLRVMQPMLQRLLSRCSYTLDSCSPSWQESTHASVLACYLTRANTRQYKGPNVSTGRNELQLQN